MGSHDSECCAQHGRPGANLDFDRCALARGSRDACRRVDDADATGFTPHRKVVAIVAEIGELATPESVDERLRFGGALEVVLAV